MVKRVAGLGCRAAYTTLSYKWRAGIKYLLTKRNKATLEAGVLEEVLPRAFMQAAQLARGIGIFYLWIDVVCIQQDSPQELNEQLAIMDEVFQGSTLILFAVAGESAYTSLESLGFRKPLLPFTLDIRAQLRGVEVSKSVYLRNFDGVELWKAQEFDHALPLYQRGWMLQ
jgi:hypothetical protein